MILNIVNQYIDDFNSLLPDSDDGFTTVGSQKKRSKYDDYYRLKEKVYTDIQLSFKDSTQYMKKQLPYLKMELTNQQLNIILNFLSTVINMVEPLIYDDIKPVAEMIGENKYIIHIQYFPRSTPTISFEQCLKERLYEDERYKHIFRAKQIREGLIKNNFINLDSIPGFYEDCHIEFKNISALSEIDEQKEMSPSSHDVGFKSDYGSPEQNKSSECNGQTKNLNRSPQTRPLNGNNKGRYTFEECFNKFLATIVAMMNTQGGSIFIPIKESQNLESEQLYSLGQIQMSEIELKNKIRSCFNEILFYKLNGDLIEEQEKTEELVNRLIPDINSIKDNQGNIKVYEIVVYQVYPEFICNLTHNQVQAENKQKQNNSKEINFEFPIRRSAANCTIVFSKDQMKSSLGKASQYNKLKKNLSEEDQNKIFYQKEAFISS